MFLSLLCLIDYQRFATTWSPLFKTRTAAAATAAAAAAAARAVLCCFSWWRRERVVDPTLPCSGDDNVSAACMLLRALKCESATHSEHTKLAHTTLCPKHKSTTTTTSILSTHSLAHERSTYAHAQHTLSTRSTHTHPPAESVCVLEVR